MTDWKKVATSSFDRINERANASDSLEYKAKGEGAVVKFCEYDAYENYSIFTRYGKSGATCPFLQG